MLRTLTVSPCTRRHAVKGTLHRNLEYFKPKPTFNGIMMHGMLASAFDTVYKRVYMMELGVKVRGSLS
jgi:hypothetical protein